MSLNGKSEVQLRDAVGLGPAPPASQPPIESLTGEPLTGELLTNEYLTCEICGQRMSERHCKIVCPNCGYTRDCSDP